MPTDNRFTGQKEDATGLVDSLRSPQAYMNARYYDPALGQFISPDTLAPDAANLFDYNRYMYVRGNPLKFTDPTGHCVDGISTVFCAIVAAAAIGAAANATGNVVGQFIEQYDANRNLLENLQSTQINGQEVAIAAGWGAVGGGAAQVTGPVGFVVANAFAGAGQKITTDMVVDGKSLEESIRDPGTEAYGGPMFARTSSAMLLNQQVQVVLGGQSALTSVAVASLSPNVPSRCNSFLDCAGEFLFGREQQTPEYLLPCTADPNDNR